MARGVGSLRHWGNDRLERATRGARQRIAVTGFFLGSEPPLDRWLARAYFGLSARSWVRKEQDPTHLAAFRAALDSIDLEPRTVADLGCGAGGTAAYMADRWPHASVLGLDISRGMVRHASRAHAVPNLAFRVADGLRLPLAAASTDLVTSLNYMPSPAEVRRVLAPHGAVVVASTFEAVGTPAISAHWSRFGFLLQEQAEASRGSFEVYRLDTGR